VSNSVAETWEPWMEAQAEARAVARAARAELQTRREALRDLLEGRFGTVPDEVLRRIEACADPARLKAAHRQALHIPSPADLQL
jgi:hypothetical protein